MIAIKSADDADPLQQIQKKLPKWVNTFARKIQPPSPAFSTNAESNYKKRSSLLADLVDSEPKILVIGSGKSTQSAADCYLDEKYAKQTINLDIDQFPTVTVVADGHKLPFKSDIFDAVIIDAVLEHVKNPNHVVNEIHLVLKEGGYVYAEIPFIQGFHSAPYDYQRFTINDIRHLFSNFEEIDAGVCVGPSSAIAWILREYLAILFSFNNDLIYQGLKMIFGWLTFWIKYFDVITAKSKHSKMIASGVYFLGKR
jgi:SAM-dependent methyltransferase